VRTQRGRALEPDLDAAAREQVNDVSSQFEVLEAHRDQASTPGGDENEEGRHTSAADGHQSATRRVGQQTAREPGVVAVHVSGDWDNKNPFVALSPDHGLETTNQTEEQHNGDGSNGEGGQRQIEVPTYQPGTGAAQPEWQSNADPNALRRRFRVAPLSGNSPPEISLCTTREACKKRHAKWITLESSTR
jgi:hypothetical protein